jgi:alpha-tubulin suppressor-like RCC1 family protein
MANATVQCWGNNGAGQLGDGTTTERHAPVSVSGINGLTDSSATAIPSFGRTLAPVVPSTSGPSAPLYVQTSDATSHSVKVSWRVPVWNGGTPITNYKIQYRKLGVTTWKTFAHRASTSKSLIVSGLDSATTYEFRVAAVNSVGTGPWGVQESTAETGDSHTCAVTVNGKVKCWGWNVFGQLGDGSTIDSHVPVAVIGFTGSEESTTAVRVSAGGLHSCAVLVNGTVKCWGDNASGQLGDGSTTPSTVPVLVSGITGQSRSSFAVNVTAGGGDTCALMANGTVKCWGYNVDGQLGDGSNSDSSTPVVVQGIDGSSPSKTAVTVHTTGPQTCALMADGTVMCWGRNNYGQLGDNSNTSSNVPVVVSGIDGLSASSTAVSVAAGGYHSCAAMADGSVQCWGSNLHGALGDGQPMDSLVPVVVSGLDGSSASSSAVSVSAGSFHSCAVLADGTSACWGWNMNGTLGDGSLADSSVPVWVSGLTGLSPASYVSVTSAGGYHSCALMVDRSLQCWGYNVDGQLGDDSTVNRLSAVDVSGLDGSNSSRSVRQAATGTTLLESRPPKRPLLSRPVPVVVIDRDADSIAIRWGVPADNGGKHIDSYRVNYRIKGSPQWTDSVTVRYSQLHLQVNGLKSGVKYEFQVRAHNVNGLGEPSRIVSETVPVRAPSPIVVKKLWNHRVIMLTWLAVQTPAHSPVTAYVMSCQVDDGETFRTRVAPDELTASVKVPTTQLYSCRVAGVTDAGRGFGSERAFVSERIQDRKQR